MENMIFINKLGVEVVIHADVLVDSRRWDVDYFMELFFIEVVPKNHLIYKVRLAAPRPPDHQVDERLLEYLSVL